jgi:hypothetical protein
MIRTAILEALDECTPLPAVLQSIVADYGGSHSFQPERHAAHGNRVFDTSLWDSIGECRPVCEDPACWHAYGEVVHHGRWYVSVECPCCLAIVQCVQKDNPSECPCANLRMYCAADTLDGQATSDVEWTCGVGWGEGRLRPYCRFWAHERPGLLAAYDANKCHKPS